MKKILCYGDSNTWGYIPLGKHTRYSRKIRYPKALQSLLGKGYKVYEEGLCSRCISNSYADKSIKYNGNLDFKVTFPKYLPLDCVVIFLGTNDMKDNFSFTSKDAANALEEYIKYIKGISNNIEIIIIAPPIIIKSTFADYENAYAKSLNFEKDYKEVVDKYNLKFVSTSDLEIGKDGIHLTKEDHLNLAKKLASLIDAN